MDYSLVGVVVAANTTVSPSSLAGCAPHPVARCSSLSRFTYNSSIGVVSSPALVSKSMILRFLVAQNLCAASVLKSILL